MKVQGRPQSLEVYTTNPFGEVHSQTFPSFFLFFFLISQINLHSFVNHKFFSFFTCEFTMPTGMLNPIVAQNNARKSRASEWSVGELGLSLGGGGLSTRFQSELQTVAFNAEQVTTGTFLLSWLVQIPGIKLWTTKTKTTAAAERFRVYL